MQVAIAVTDAGNGSDDGGGSGAEGFGEFSSGVSGEDFVDRELAFFRGDAHLAKQSQSGVARDAGQDGSAERRSNGFAVQNKEDVHDAGFFDVAALDAVEPKDIVKAFFLGEAGGEEAAGIVASGFAVSGAAGESANEALFVSELVRLNRDRAGPIR